MFGGGSIQLARVFGIRIGVDPSWFVVLFLIIWLLSGHYGDLFPDQEGKSFGLAVASALLFFLSVLLHELGHAVVAMRSGISISGIDLWMFGGVAKMERDTRSPGEEFRVAVAGPVVTLLIVLLCAGAGALASDWDTVIEGSQFETGAIGGTTAVLSYLAFVNAALLVFNLIPGFPLDGGRIARAAAWKLTGNRHKATRFAARMGRGFAYLLIGVGVLFVLAVPGGLISGIWFVFIGMFLNQAARSAEVQSALQSRIEGLRVVDVMDSEPVAVPEQLTLDLALEDFFLRYGYPWFPVVDESGVLVGLVTKESVDGLPDSARGERTVASVMAGDAAGSGLRVDLDEPLEALLGREGLQRLGAMLAVDGDGRLRGIVTVDQVRRALRPLAAG